MCHGPARGLHASGTIMPTVHMGGEEAGMKQVFSLGAPRARGGEVVHAGAASCTAPSTCAYVGTKSGHYLLH